MARYVNTRYGSVVVVSDAVALDPREWQPEAAADGEKKPARKATRRKPAAKPDQE